MVYNINDINYLYKFYIYMFIDVYILHIKYIIYGSVLDFSFNNHLNSKVI